jgi:lipid II isoglutaminyl synthase (glutamine-hydrolysing)
VGIALDPFTLACYAATYKDTYVKAGAGEKISMPKNKSSHPIRDVRKRRKNSSTDSTPAAVDHYAKTTGSRHLPRRRSSLRAGLAVIGGRAAGALSRRLRLGGGTSIAGIVAQSLYPDIIGHLSTQLAYGSILVTGTNGKTTTSGLIAAILSDAGLRVWRNREGSNLMRGVAGALVIRAQPSGNLRRAGQAISIFEVDEAVMPQVVHAVPPRVAVFTNLFRDQLDRYGEVDSVLARWKQAVGLLPGSTTLILNADDPNTAFLGASFAGQVVYFGIDDPALDLVTQDIPTERHQVIDAYTCPYCGGEYQYSLRYYSHLGHYTCTNCKRTRPQASVRAVKVYTDSFDRLRIAVQTPSRQGEIVIPLAGFYNIYNALAAVAAAQSLDIAWEPIVSGIEQFKPVFGRGERIQVEGRTLRLLLAKNPTGFNEVLRTLFSDGMPRHILFVLNDNIADGRDVSWIWDVDFERILQQTASLTAAGTRAFDLALRLKYAGVAQQDMTVVLPTPLRAAKTGLKPKAQTRRRRSQTLKVEAARSAQLSAPVAEKSDVINRPSTTGFGIAKALDVAIRQTPAGETLFVVPTYTGLLEIHRELERRGLTPHYWEEKGP